LALSLDISTIARGRYGLQMGEKTMGVVEFAFLWGGGELQIPRLRFAPLPMNKLTLPSECVSLNRLVLGMIPS
jgi:hypothetical protein